MKKIVAATLVASMVAGATFAEVKISSNFRIRPVIAEWNMGTEADTHARYFDLDGVQAAKDTIKFDAKNDYAGVTLTVDNNLTGNAFAFDTYNGFLKFGNLTFTGGKWDCRVANRVTKDQNDLSLLEQNWAATYNSAEPVAAGSDKYKTKKTNEKFMGNKKLGINANCGAGIGIDSDNISAINGTKAISFIADYLMADVAGGKLQFWAALNKANDEWKTLNDDGQTTTEVDSSYAFRGAFTNDSVAVNADLQLRHRKMAAALFVSPALGKDLTSVFGFTFANDDDAKGEDADKYWAIDARVRSAIDDAMAVTLFLNYTNANKGDDEDASGVLDTVANFTYKLSDVVTTFAEAELVFFTNSDDRKAAGSQLAAQVGGIFTAGKGATLDAAVRMTMAGLGADQDKDTLGTQISIPVCMRIKL